MRSALLLLPALAAASAVPPAEASILDMFRPRPAARPAAPRRAAPRRAIALPQVAGPKGRPLVVIDAGHGGHDPGAPGTPGPAGIRREKAAALGLATAVRDALVKGGRVRVALTRSGDRFLILGDRREIARRLGADLFISIHADSAPNPLARGATIYTLSDVASDRVAAQLAAKENRADVIAGVDLGGESAEVSSILIDLARRETMNVSSTFAGLLQRELSPLIRFRTNFHKFAGFVVLKAPDVPSILFEAGYMSNTEDEALLFSDDYRQKVARGMRAAIEAHFAKAAAR